MKRFVIASLASAAMVLAGCATNEPATGANVNAKSAASNPAGPEVVTGSRIARTTTDRLVKSTVQDKADEPVRSMGNVVGARGN
jgi:PBP1b-binding outer membrane lipoprotein LpoB